MKKLLLLFAVLLGTVGAWGFSLPYYQSSWNVFWKSAAGETLNESLTHASCSGSVYFHESNIFLTGTGTVSITFDYTTGTKKIVILGVEVIDPNEGTVLYSDYHIGESGSIDSKNTYTFDVTETEKRQCKIRYYVCHESGDHALNLTTGQIHVSGPVEEVPIETELSTEYYYTIKNVSHSSFLSAASDYALALPSNQINYQVKSMWALEKDESTGKYKLRNAMYNNYLGHIATDNKAWPMKSQQEATNFSVNVEVEEVESHPAYITICYDDNADHGCAHDANWGSSYNWKQIVGWESTASASQWIFTKTDVPTSTRYEMVSLTYSFVYNGVEKFTQRCNEVVVGFPYPDITVLFPLGITAANKPDGNVPSEVNGTTVTIQLSENVPFEYYSSYEEIRRWYYLKFDSNNNYYLYNKDGQSYISLDRKALEIGDIDSHAWAFVGNPFDGYKIYNKATGAAKILSSSTTMTGNTGDGTYPVLTETPIPKGNNELWYATASSHATNGFFLEQKGHSSNKLNNRGKLAYWTGGAGTGSTFVVENAIPVKLTTDDSNPIFYALKTGRDWDYKEWWYNYDSSDGKIYLTQFDDSNAQWWYFKGQNINNKLCVQLVPKADPTKVMSYADSENGTEKIVAQPDGTQGYTNTWRFAFKGGRYVLQTSNGSNYLSNNGGRNNGYVNKMGLWSEDPDTDSGTALYIYETMFVALSDNAGNVHTGYGLYELESLAAPKMNGAHALALSNIQRGETFTADVDFGIPVSNVDGTADNLFLITPFNSGNSLRYYVDGNYDVLVNDLAFTSANVDNYQWAVYPCLSGNEFSFVIKNYGTGRYIKTDKTVSSDGINDVGAVTVVEDVKDATHFTLETNNRFKIPGYELRMSVTSSGTSPQYVTVHSGQDHSGVNNHFTVVSDIVNNWKSDNTAKVGYVGYYPRSSSNELNAIETYKDMLLFKESHEEIELHEGYYYIKGTGTGNNADWYATMTDGNKFNAQALANAAELGVSQLIRLVSCDKGYRFQAYGNSRYVTLDNASTNNSSASNIASLENEGTKFTFTDNGSGKFTIKGVFVVTSENGEPKEVSHFMRTENGGAINYWDTESNETWYLIQAPELPLTIHSTGYSTFSAAVDVEVPEGVTAYYAKEQIGDSHIRMYPITTIPANEGVVIKGTGSATVKFPIIADAAELPADAENLLKAHLNTEAVTPANGNSVFVMATRNEVTGFYPLSTTNNTIGGHKSYLEIPSTPAARLSIIWDDTETGVFEVEGGEQNTEIYDLTGRRLDKPTKGVNVVGGKLVIK